MTNDKIQITNQIKIANVKKSKQKYDLEERTLMFAKRCIILCKMISSDITNNELTRQLVRSASSVGANYREANDSATPKEFYHRIGICRKEAKESRYWLQLLEHSNNNTTVDMRLLIDESYQLACIFAAISNSAKK